MAELETEAGRRTIGVICGGGALPREAVAGIIAKGDDYFLIGLKGSVDPWIKAHPHAILSPGQVGGIFRALEKAGCDHLMMAGAVARPALQDLRVDLTAVRHAPRFIQLFRQGDDGLLRGLASMFEARGLRLIGPQEFVPDALAAKGPITGRPSILDMADVDKGAALLAALSPFDVGQAAVVANTVCLGVEAVEGTRRLLERVASFPDHRRGSSPRPSGVLVKAPKLGQDVRLDLPAIGPDTIDQAAAAGLNGIALAADMVFLLERAETLRRAAAQNIFIYGFERRA